MALSLKMRQSAGAGVEVVALDGGATRLKVTTKGWTSVVSTTPLEGELCVKLTIEKLTRSSDHMFGVTHGSSPASNAYSDNSSCLLCFTGAPNIWARGAQRKEMPGGMGPQRDGDVVIFLYDPIRRAVRAHSVRTGKTVEVGGLLAPPHYLCANLFYLESALRIEAASAAERALCERTLDGRLDIEGRADDAPWPALPPAPPAPPAATLSSPTVPLPAHSTASTTSAATAALQSAVAGSDKAVLQSAILRWLRTRRAARCRNSCFYRP